MSKSEAKRLDTMQPVPPPPPAAAPVNGALVDATAPQLPAYLQQGGPARGSENVKSADLVIPRLEIVQALSPCRKDGDAAFIEGAKEGMLYNNVTRELYGSKAQLIPVFFQKEYLIWKDRKKGGGFRGAFPTKEQAEAVRAGLEDGGDCESLDTAEQFCLLVRPNGQCEEIVVSMARSKMKVSRKWNSLIRMGQCDSFARVYNITTVREVNSKNQDYFNFQIAAMGFVPEPLYRRGEALYKQIKAGAVGIDRSQDDGAEPGDDAPNTEI